MKKELIQELCEKFENAAHLLDQVDAVEIGHVEIGKQHIGEQGVLVAGCNQGGAAHDRVVVLGLLDRDPAFLVEAQATDRAHRIGQDKPVFVHKLVALDTIEVKMAELKARKQALADGLFDPEAGSAVDIGEDDIEFLLGN